MTQTVRPRVGPRSPLKPLILADDGDIAGVARRSSFSVMSAASRTKDPAIQAK